MFLVSLLTLAIKVLICLCALKVCHININTPKHTHCDASLMCLCRCLYVGRKTLITLSYIFFLNSVDCAFILKTHIPAKLF